MLPLGPGADHDPLPFGATDPAATLGAKAGGAPRHAPPPAGRPLVPERLVRDPLAAADPVVLLRPPADVERVDARAAVDDPSPEVGLDPVVAGARLDQVPAVARVDEVASGAAVEAIALARALP